MILLYNFCIYYQQEIMEDFDLTITALKNSIEVIIEKYITNISEKYNIEKKELLGIWEKGIDTVKLDHNNCENENTTKTCSYTFTRGKKKGIVCGLSVTTGDMFCSKHIKQGTNIKEQKINILPRNVIKSSTIVLKRNKNVDRLWHPESKLVFNDNNTVTHRLIDDQLRQLNDDDIKICKKLGFAYYTSDENLIESAHSFTKTCLQNRDKSHDYSHSTNVLDNALKIWNKMNGKIEYSMIDVHSISEDLNPETIIVISSLLHDVCDHKYKTDKDLSKELDSFLNTLGSYSTVIRSIINNISYSKELNNKLDKLQPQVEFLRNVVSDADKIEAIGEVGITRCFAYEKHISPNLDDNNIKKKVIEHCKNKLINIYPHYIKTTGGRLLAEKHHTYIKTWLSLNVPEPNMNDNVISDINDVEELLNDLQMSSDEESIDEEED